MSISRSLLLKASEVNLSGDTYKNLVEEIKATLSELQDISEICGQCDFKKLCNKVLPKNI